MLSCALSIIQAPNLTTLNYLKVSKISHTSQTRNPHARPSVGQPSVQSNVRATLTTMPSGLKNLLWTRYWNICDQGSSSITPVKS